MKKLTDTQLAIILIGVVVVIVVVLYYKKQIYRAVSDAISERRIETLHPKVRLKVRELLNRSEKAGVKLRVTDATRTYEEQDRLFQQGVDNPAKLVTHARGGQSYHNFGLAIDAVDITDGTANYNSKQFREIVVPIAKQLGFKWGGDPDFAGGFDQPHFEMTFGYTPVELDMMYRNGQVDKDGFVTI